MTRNAILTGANTPGTPTSEQEYDDVIDEFAAIEAESDFLTRLRAHFIKLHDAESSARKKNKYAWVIAILNWRIEFHNSVNEPDSIVGIFTQRVEVHLPDQAQVITRSLSLFEAINWPDTEDYLDGYLSGQYETTTLKDTVAWIKADHAANTDRFPAFTAEELKTAVVATARANYEPRERPTRTVAATQPAEARLEEEEEAAPQAQEKKHATTYQIIKDAVEVEIRRLDPANKTASCFCMPRFFYYSADNTNIKRKLLTDLLRKLTVNKDLTESVSAHELFTMRYRVPYYDNEISLFEALQVHRDLIHLPKTAATKNVMQALLSETPGEITFDKDAFYKDCKLQLKTGHVAAAAA